MKSMALDAMEKALEQTGPHDFRDAVTHLQVVDRADIPRMARLNVIASTDPHWFDMEPVYFDMMVAVLGEERAENQLPMKSFFDAGVVVTSASDYPVTNPAYPLIGMQKGVIRQLPGRQDILHGASERVTIEQMIEATTINEAYQMLCDDRLGSITVGKEADLVVLGDDITKCDPEHIQDAPVPGLSYYVRKDGHVTGNIFEAAAETRFLIDGAENLTDEQIDTALKRWTLFSVNAGVVGVFDAGMPECNDFHERVYRRLKKMDEEGELPVYIDGCYVITQPRQVPEALESLKRFKNEFNTEHLKVHTLKIFNDGTLKIETAALVTPYEDTVDKGTAAFNKDQIADLLKQLNEAGLDLHLHTVGEGASRNVLDGVEIAKRELGDNYHVKVTCAHLEIQDDADIERFAKLGVNANYTPWWHAGNMGGDPHETWCKLLGEKRADKMYRCKSVWKTGANVTWSSDDIHYGDFNNWSPYLGMEVGMTRWINEKTRAAETDWTVRANPSEDEQMSAEEMILGYTINGAKQLGIENGKGSIETGKDANFLVFDNDLLTAEHEGFSHNKPSEVFICGEKVN